MRQGKIIERGTPYFSFLATSAIIESEFGEAIGIWPETPAAILVPTAPSATLPNETPELTASYWIWPKPVASVEASRSASAWSATNNSNELPK